MGKATGIRYLFKRERGGSVRFFVRVRVPRDIAHVFPRPFVETFLHTSDKATARAKVDGAVAEIKSRFARARQGGAPTREELAYQTAATVKSEYDAGLIAGDPLFVASPDARAAARLTLVQMGIEASEANVEAMAGAIEHGVREAQMRWDRRMPPPPLPERPAPRVGSPEALGNRVEEWLEAKRDKWGQRLSDHSIEIARMAVKRFADHFPRVENVTREGIEAWVRSQVDGGLKAATIHRYIPLLRSYWEFLKVPGQSPFDNLRRKLPAAAPSDRESFKDKEVVTLLEAARGKGDQKLVNLIYFLMYTGCRLGEAAQLKCEHVDWKAGTFRILKGKTRWARREIPIHTKLDPVLRELCRHTSIGAVIFPGAIDGTANRFSKLKTEMGFGPEKTLHSIRHTFTNMLMPAEGVKREFVTALLGHAPDSFTVRTYGKDGIPIELKRDAIKALVYPDPEPTGEAE